MKILVYSFNDKIGDGLQKVSFLQQLRLHFPKAEITYTTSYKTSLKRFLHPLIKNYINIFIEDNEIKSSLKLFFIKNKIFKDSSYDLIIDLQKVVIRTLLLKKIAHKKFFSASANFLFSDFKNVNNLKFKKIYIEQFYFNILSIITNKNLNTKNIKIPFYKMDYLNIDSKKIKVAISPGASSIERSWQFEKYLEIAKFLRQEDYLVYFFLGPDEFKYLDVCIKNDFACPEWDNNRKIISNNILFIMNLAKKMDYCLSNDSGTSWFFQFAGVKTLKIFGKTNAIKFARPNFCDSIQTSDYGFHNIQDFPVELYKKKLTQFLNFY